MRIRKLPLPKGDRKQELSQVGDTVGSRAAGIAGKILGVKPENWLTGFLSFQFSGLLHRPTQILRQLLHRRQIGL
jgi:hypothetical protein